MIGEENAGCHLMEHEEEHHHSHSHNHGHDELHDHGDSMDQALSHIKENLRGSNIRFEKRRRLVGGNYNYQVDLYIEVDQTLVNDNGGVFNPNTVNYVNLIVTGANTIFEVSVLDVSFPTMSFFLSN